MPDQTPNLSLPYIFAAQAQKHVTHNEAIRVLDALVQLAVIDDTQASPPATPSDGDRYIVPAGATGSWAGHAGHVAAYQDGGWTFFAPQGGWIAWVASSHVLTAFDGTAWVPVVDNSLNPVPLVGVNASADATNRLAVSSPCSLFNHEGHGHQQKVNKAASTETSSVLFQTGFSGRAEIGLTGDDNLHFKVSPDGSTWKEGLIIERNTGAPRVPTFSLSSRPAASTAGAGALIYVPDASGGPAVQVSTGTSWASLSGSSSLTPAPLRIFIGESGSAGAALNTDASAPELAAQAQVQIWNPVDGVFQSLDIGTNNILGHDGFYGGSATWHGWELQLASAISAGRYTQSTAYLVKCGQGGSQIGQWRTDTSWKLSSGTVVDASHSFTSSGTGARMWEVAEARISAAVAAMQAAGKTPLPEVWISIGLNDESGSSTYGLSATTNWTQFRTDLESLIARLRTLLGASTPVVLMKFEAPMQVTTNVNAQIDTIDAADANVVVATSAGCQTKSGDSRHLSYLGNKLMAERLIDAGLGLVATATAPSISPAAGTYVGAQTVTVTPAVGALRTLYTTDDSDPLVGTLYTAPFSVTPPGTVKARTIQAGKRSAEASAIYTVPSVSEWSASDAATYFTLSNGNRSIVRSASGGTWRTVKGSIARNAGKRYYEFKITSASTGAEQVIFGVCSPGHALSSYIGNATNSAGFGAGPTYRTGGNFTTAGGAVGSYTPALNSVLMVAVDFDAGKIWYGKDGTWFASGDPAAGTNPSVTFTPGVVGTLHTAISSNAVTSEGTWTLQTSAVQISHSVPSGFSAWDS